jgi:uncharacterized protein
VYEAFGRGDAAAILEAATDDVGWAAEAASSAAPWYGVRHGRDAEMDLHHYFKFRDGKIACYRGTEDTAQTETVLRD